MSGKPSARLYADRLGKANKLERAAWKVVQLVGCYWLPLPFLNGWRIRLLRLFGARIGRGCKVYPGVRVWLPRNLEMGDYSCIGHETDCYNVAPIRFGNYATVSQRSFLCSASHDIRQRSLPLTFSPISIGDYAWICAEAFVGPGVNVGEGAVLGARAVAVADLDEWTVYRGNPAKAVKSRERGVEQERAAHAGS